MDIFELKQLIQIKDYCSPFEHSTEGFNDSWWHGYAEKLDSPLDEKHQYFQFLLNGVEVGRADIIPFDLAEEFRVTNRSIQCWHITFFEIRKNYRGQGVGTQFTQMLSGTLSDHPIIAFSQDADLFWERVGWIKHDRYPNEDGTELNNLFINFQLNLR